MKKTNNKKQRTLEEANMILREKLRMIKTNLLSLLKALENDKS